MFNSSHDNYCKTNFSLTDTCETDGDTREQTETDIQSHKLPYCIDVSLELNGNDRSSLTYEGLEKIQSCLAWWKERGRGEAPA